MTYLAVILTAALLACLVASVTLNVRLLNRLMDQSTDANAVAERTLTIAEQVSKAAPARTDKALDAVSDAIMRVTNAVQSTVTDALRVVLPTPETPAPDPLGNNYGMPIPFYAPEAQGDSDPLDRYIPRLPPSGPTAALVGDGGDVDNGTSSFGIPGLADPV